MFKCRRLVVRFGSFVYFVGFLIDFDFVFEKKEINFKCCIYLNFGRVKFKLVLVGVLLLRKYVYFFYVMF